MKKFLLVLAISTAFVACNNDATTTEDVNDSIANNVDSAANAMKDSVEATSDSVKNAIDSAADAKIDTLKKN